MVSRGGPTGVQPREAAFDPRAFLEDLARRDLHVEERELSA
jgi:hypothetical protein